jgi:3-hydroxy-3-methylglutaryl CoA synthase
MRWLTSAAGAGDGTRTLAFWDEDSITMAVAAVRDAFRQRQQPAFASLRFATTTPPFAEPLCASLIHAALRLEAECVAEDSVGTPRAGLAALHLALEAGRPALVAAADRPIAQAGSATEARVGDGAAAAVVGPGPGLLRYIAGISIAAPFVERYRAADAKTSQDWEERWVREAGYLNLVPQAIEGALRKAGMSAADIDHVILPCTIPGCAQAVTRKAGLKNARLASTLAEQCGDTGTAHALLMLALAMEEIRPGERVLVAQFGQGATALLFEAEAGIADFAATVTPQLSNGIVEHNYLKLLVFQGLVPWEKGLRGRVNVNEALSTAYRNADALLGFVGSRNRDTGVVQFPPLRPPSDAGQIVDEPNPHEPWPLADRGGRIATCTADLLAFSRHPPNCYGLVDFGGGGRLMMDFTDPDAARLAPGDAVRFVFRIKDVDERTGYRRYFWKAVAADPSSPEASHG